MIPNALSLIRHAVSFFWSAAWLLVITVFVCFPLPGLTSKVQLESSHWILIVLKQWFIHCNNRPRRLRP